MRFSRFRRLIAVGSHRLRSSTSIDVSDIPKRTPSVRFLSSAQRRDDGSTSSDDERAGDDISFLVREYGKKPHTPASLQMLTKDLLASENHSPPLSKDKAFMGRLGRRLAAERVHIQLASFLRHEIPIRLAHRIQDLEQVHLMKDMPSVREVKQVYIDSFRELVNFPPIYTAEDEAAFSLRLSELYKKHSGVLVQMARGAFELRAAVRRGEISRIAAGGQVRPLHSLSDALPGDFLEFETLHQCHSFLDRFYSSRIGIRVLVGQYLALRHRHQQIESGELSPHTDADEYIGMVCLQTSPNLVVRHAVRDATAMCRRKYNGRAPMVEIQGQLDLTFPFIPTYLHYILLELLKNALRATAETHLHKRSLPSITVVIADGQDNEDVVIKICDEGGGIRRSQMNKVWSYLYTTADPSIQEAFISDKQKDHDNVSPIAGLGYGLPIARAYCRHFGGSLDLISMESYGTDAFVHLKRLGDTKRAYPYIG